MGLFDICKNCVECGKNGLFAKLDTKGYCPECAKKRDALLEAKRNRAKETANQRIERILHPISISSNTPVSEQDLDSVNDRITMRVPVIGSSVQLYSYIKVPVTDVDRDALFDIYTAKRFEVNPILDTNASVILFSEFKNAPIAKLSSHITMCKDWIRRKDLIRCEFTGFKAGAEHVVLAFYRDETKRLADHSSVTVKLSSCFSEAKQEGIRLLVSGEKLACSEDGYIDGKVNVLDYCAESIGRLPKKYADMFLSDGFAGIFFDHAEENENFKLVPFVKIYLN